MNLSHLNVQERKAFLLKQLKTGKVMSCTWETKAGITTRTIKLFAERAFVSGDKRFVQPPSNTKEQYLNVVDMAKFNSEVEYPWSTINLETIKALKCGGNCYDF